MDVLDEVDVMDRARITGPPRLFSLHLLRAMKRRIVLTLLPIFLFALVCSAKTYHLTNDPSVPAASGKLETDHDHNGNTKLSLKVYNLAKPTNLSPAKNTYVVWVQPNGQPAQNLGELKLGDQLKGEFEGVTPAKSFDLFVTAEDNATAAAPSGIQLLKTRVQQ